MNEKRRKLVEREKRIDAEMTRLHPWAPTVVWMMALSVAALAGLSFVFGAIGIGITLTNLLSVIWFIFAAICSTLAVVYYLLERPIRRTVL